MAETVRIGCAACCDADLCVGDMVRRTGARDNGVVLGAAGPVGGVMVMFESDVLPVHVASSELCWHGRCKAVEASVSLSNWNTFFELGDLMRLRLVGRNCAPAYSWWVSRWVAAVDGSKHANLAWVDRVIRNNLAPRRPAHGGQAGPAVQPRCMVNELILRALLPERVHAILGRKDDIQPQLLQTLTLDGFVNPDLNKEYTARLGKAFGVHGRNTFWSNECRHFLFWHPSKCWSLAPATEWFTVKLEGDGGLCAHTKNGVELQKAVGWFEFDGPGAPFEFQRSACVKAVCESKISIRVKKDSLLDTIPGAAQVLQVFGHKTTSAADGELVALCRMLQEYPTDEGRLASSLRCGPWQLLDLDFLDICQEAQHLAARLEEDSAAAVADLVAAEARERAQSRVQPKSRKNRRKKRSKSGPRPSMPDAESESDASAGPEAAVSEARAQDISEQLGPLRHSFPMFDDDILGEH